jgi:TolB-like protein
MQSLYLASLDSPDRTLVFEDPDASNVVYANGHLLFLREQTLMAQPFDMNRFKAFGRTGADCRAGANLPQCGSVFRVDDGRPRVRHRRHRSAVTPDVVRQFGEPPGGIHSAGYGDVELSPDGARASMSVRAPAGAGRDIWLLDLARRVPSRFTFDPAIEMESVWSPDGTRIVFNRSRNGRLDLFEKTASGVRRWEKREELPVRRHRHAKLGSVYAFTEEIDAWYMQRSRVAGDQSAAGGGQRNQAVTAGAGDADASVAALPFANLSADLDDDYFCDGLADEIINALGRVSALRVIARTSSFAFKGMHDDIRRIASLLGVGHVLEGSIRRSGATMRVVAQLIRASDGCQIWSARYDRELIDVFAVQDDIAAAIATALKLTLTSNSQLVTAYAPRFDAYEAYLKARYQLSSGASIDAVESSHCLPSTSA